MIKKGSIVWLIRSYNHAGIVSIRKCIVTAWGKKQARLSHMNHEMTKHRINHAHRNDLSNPLNSTFVFEDGTADIDAEARALVVHVLAWQKQHYEKCLKTSTNHRFQESIQQLLTAIDTAVPTVIDKTWET